MNDRYSADYPEDEPVIGGGYAPAAPPPLPPPGDPRYPGLLADTHEDGPDVIDYSGAYADDEYADAEYEEDEYYDDEYEDGYDEYYDDEYDEHAPARQPMFYVFVALAALVGGIIVFLLFSLINNGDGNGNGTGGAEFAVAIDSPVKDKRVEIGKAEEVIVQASATEAITRFELFIGDKLTDTVNVTETPPDNKYHAVLKYTLATKGNYELLVKVTSSSGATKESNKVRVIAVEPVGDRPQTIKGKVVADTTLRTGPGDSFPEAGTLTAGTEVTILGKNRAVEWLLVDTVQGQRWAKRAAIDPLDSLDLVPVRDVTPTPAPTLQPTNTAVPSPSTSPTPNPDAPDFVPTNAVLIAGGAKLRVTVQNTSARNYAGPLVISVSGDVPADKTVVNAQLNGNGGTTVVEFDVSPPITTTGKKAIVSVDPDNAVKESREDNNGATFVLLPPEEAPVIGIQSATVAGTISVVLKNTGGDLPSTTVLVKVTLGGDSTQKSVQLALAPNQTSAAIDVTKPAGTGEATVEVIIGSTVAATAKVTLP